MPAKQTAHILRLLKTEFTLEPFRRLLSSGLPIARAELLPNRLEHIYIERRGLVAEGRLSNLIHAVRAFPFASHQREVVVTLAPKLAVGEVGDFGVGLYPPRADRATSKE